MGIDFMLKFFKDLVTSYGPSYVVGGANAVSLQLLGETIDRMVEKVPLLKEAGLRGEYFTPLGSITYWEDIYSQIKLTNRELGIGGELGRNFEQISMDAYKSIIQYGGEMSDLTDAYRAFTSEYGRNMMFSSEELNNMADLRVAFGEGVESIFSMNQMVGRSISDTSDFLDDVYRNSDAVGVNVRSTMEGIRQNLSIIDRYSFVRGSRALADMAINAERMRISIDRTVALADDLYDPENAIDIASQLQMLGGEFAKLGDPFELIFLARNEPEELQRRIAGVTAGMAALNERTGEIDIDPLGFSQLREFAKIANQDVQELAQAARQMAREGYVGNMLSVDFKTRNDFDNILSKISSIAQYQDGEWQVNLGQEIKTVSELTIADLDQLKAIKDGEEKPYRALIESNRTLTQSIQILTNSLMRNLIGDDVYQMADSDMKGLIQNLDEKVLGSAVFEFMQTGLGAMQGQVYDNVSTLAKGVMEGNWAGIKEQFAENIWHPLQQFDETLNGMNMDDNVVVKGMHDVIDPMLLFFEEGRTFFKDAKYFMEHPWQSSFFGRPPEDGDGTKDAGSLSGLDWIRGGGSKGSAVGGYTYHDILGFTTIEEADQFNARRGLVQGLLNEDNPNTNITLDVNGNVQLELDGKTIDLDVFNTPEKANALLESLKPYFNSAMSNKIETRIHQLGEDARNSGNKTTQPN